MFQVFWGLFFIMSHDRSISSIPSLTAYSITVFENDFFALQITDNSFGKEKNREDSVIVPTHYLLLENLLLNCNVLIFNTPRKVKQPKETNWKQKFQKLQNENICLTCLNMETNGNLHFLAFCESSLMRYFNLK